jgi:hypothetical protein
MMQTMQASIIQLNERLEQQISKYQEEVERNQQEREEQQRVIASHAVQLEILNDSLRPIRLELDLRGFEATWRAAPKDIQQSLKIELSADILDEIRIRGNTQAHSFTLLTHLETCEQLEPQMLSFGDGPPLSDEQRRASEKYELSRWAFEKTFGVEWQDTICLRPFIPDPGSQFPRNRCVRLIREEV